MRVVVTIILALGCGLSLGTACSDRKAKHDEEAQRLCTGFCEKYEDCDLPADSPTVEECIENCTSYEWTWDEACRAEYVASYECINALSCQDFAITEHIEEGEASCEKERSASGRCTTDNGGIDRG